MEEGQVGGVGQTMILVPIASNIGNVCHDPLFQPVAELFQTSCFGGQGIGSYFARFSQTNDTGHIFGSRSPAPLLRPAMKQGGEFNTLPYNKGANPFRGVELVA